MEDSRITELFTLRDESAVTETESKYGGYCHALAFNILGDPNDAEETVSDALFQLWQAIPPEKPKSLGAYFAKITRNIALNRIERSSAKKRGSGELRQCRDGYRHYRPPAVPKSACLYSGACTCKR